MRRWLQIGTSVSLLLISSIVFATGSSVWHSSIEWITDPIDHRREHNVAALAAWHARIMFLAWGFLLPLGVLIARFFKVWPGQDWPLELDRQEWWRGHLILQCSGSVLAIAGVSLMVLWGDAHEVPESFWHRLFGWLSMSCLVVQVLGGFIRGTAGGPTYPAPDGSHRGDHYDMTLHRKVFEHIHKSLGYFALLSGVVAIGLGLWLLNAPRWMWITISGWWCIILITAFILQKNGRAIDTYQAIWGVDPKHPGNTMKPVGVGIHRHQEKQ